MIPLDRVRAMLAAATPGPWDNGALQVYSVAGCPLHGPGGNPLADASVSRCVCRVVVNSALDDDRPLIAAAPDLAAQALTLAAALETAERGRDEARRERDEAESDVIDQCVPLQEEVVDLRRALTTAREATTLATEREAAAVAERDAARQAHAELAAAVRAEREARNVMDEASQDYEDGVAGIEPYNAALAAWVPTDDAVVALLSGAPAPSMVSAALVRAYLAAERDVEHDFSRCKSERYDSLREKRAALDAALARCP